MSILSRLIIVVGLLSSSNLFSQISDSIPNLYISVERPIKVYFPGKVRQAINMNSDIEIKVSERNYIEIKARTPYLFQTRIEIITADLRHFPFEVVLSEAHPDFKETFSIAGDRKRRHQTKNNPSLSKSDIN